MTRPQQPGLRLQPLSHPASAPIWSDDISIDIPRLPDAEPRSRLTWFHAGAGAFAALVLLASVLTWNWSEALEGRRFADFNAIAPNGPWGASDEIARLLSNSDKDDFFGIQLSRSNTSIVVDDRNRLAGYGDDVAILAYAANDYIRSHGGSLNMIEARLSDSGAIDSELDPFYALPTLRIQSVMKKFDEADRNRSHLDAAFALTRPASPEQVFVVLAEPLSAEEESELGAAIRASRVPVHLIALGEAATQHYASLVSMTGGKFIPVSDRALGGLLERCNVKMPAHSN